MINRTAIKKIKIFQKLINKNYKLQKYSINKT